ncbi:sugar transferase [Cohnella cellulosilytica]|uniref:Sugar transferase n=1 Tax=Cohnella cellulosilytica TaxID=986710 RepID=A0ABW2FAD4_9BACL
MKRLIDFAGAIILSIIVFPVIVVVSVLITITIGKPIFFQQQRPGLKGRPFTIFKFRTMSGKRDELGLLLSDEQRMTSLGRILRKYSIDEIPQLWNVLKGELSFVGPRPLLMDYLDRYTPEQARRHEVRPGITGWAQVNGRNAISWEEKFKLDIWYVDNHSIWLDFKIIWLTLKKVVRSEGISQENHVSMEEFRG